MPFLMDTASQYSQVAAARHKLNRTQSAPISADFVGLRIPDRFVFGCGMDAKGFWRNLPEIRAMKE